MEWGRKAREPRMDSGHEVVEWVPGRAGVAVRAAGWGNVKREMEELAGGRLKCRVADFSAPVLLAWKPGSKPCRIV
jgi:hypothetical protein